MIIDTKTLQKQQPQRFKKAQLQINQYEDKQRREVYFYTLVEKQGDWFNKSVNLVLRYTKDASGNQYYLYFQRNVRIQDDVGLMPTNQTKQLLRLNKIKLIVRKSNFLTIVFMNQSQKIQQTSFKFKQSSVAKKWEQMIRQNKNKANDIDLQQQQNSYELLQEARHKIRYLETQLIHERKMKNKILHQYQYISQSRDHYLSLFMSLQNNTTGNDPDIDNAIREQLLNKQQTILNLNNKIVDLQKKLQSYQKQKQQIFFKRSTGLQQLQALNQTLRHENHLLICQIQLQIKKHQQLLKQLNSYIDKYQEQQNLKKDMQQQLIYLKKKLLQRNAQLAGKLPLTKSTLISNMQDLEFRIIKDYNVKNAK